MAYKTTFRGIVQGVGFRPWLYRECVKKNLRGFVRNTGESVELFTDKKIGLNQLLRNKPELARIISSEITQTKTKLPQEFLIKPSQKSSTSITVPPDISICKDCLQEIFDPENRRYQYPLIACTNCGPRFSIVKDSPYDRKNTAMYKFPLCLACKAEYANPNTRWYHAETTACPKCGPKCNLYYKNKLQKPKSLIKKTAQLISQNKIIAIKGVGGFHLVCNAKSRTVKKLRQITGRPTKPYALLIKNLETAKKLCYTNKLEEEYLQSQARPIVICQKKKAKSLNSTSPLNSLGLILPYTGLHYLLFEHIDEPLIFTSANLPDKPLTTKRSEQFVDYVLDHNRQITNPIDDSVIKIISNQALLLRKARGYAPGTEFEGGSQPAPTPRNRHSLALGAEQNNTFCFSKYISQHQGNTRNPATLKRMQKNLQKQLKLQAFEPKQVITDLHPEYRTPQFGKSLAPKLKIPHKQIQHHLAHLKSVAAEHGIEEFIGIAADGAGYGLDNTIWGGEIIRVNKNKWQRVGSLELQPMLGGDLATKEPTRMLFGILARFLDEQKLYSVMHKHYAQKQLKLLYSQFKQNYDITQTSSTGRILDAISALLGFCAKRTYEGEPAIVLESESTTPYKIPKPIISVDQGGSRPAPTLRILETTPLFKYLLKNLHKNKSKLAATAQLYLAKGFLELAKQNNPNNLPILFSGGVAYNKIITTYLTNNQVLINKKIPPGDGGISYGQITAI